MQLKPHWTIKKKHAKNFMSYSHDFIDIYAHVINCCFYQFLLLLHEILKKTKELLNILLIKKIGNIFKDIDITNPAYYFFDDSINIKNIDPNKTKKGKRSYKNFLIYYIEYVTV